ncbi:hypothetical protein F4802DRAFT_245601 [Xylaria palmicola]|nr:hypothetical protein F4802DRAFT_245601 [Xylaria palmicola]
MPASMNYDVNTGLVFRQWDVSIPEAVSEPWNRVSNTMGYSMSGSPPPRPPRRRGPDSLVDICLRATAQHVTELDQAHIQYLPSTLVGRLWELVDTPSVEAWKLFATKITRDEEAVSYVCPCLMRYIFSVPKKQPLEAYLAPLTSATFEYLTHLTIAGVVKGSTHELLPLTQLKNLAILEVIEPWGAEHVLEYPRVTDSVVREWANSPNPFPVLRVLRIWGNEYVTRRSLDYLQAFPFLVLYDVAGRRRDWEGMAEDCVWKPRKRTWTTRLSTTIEQQHSLFEEIIPRHQLKRQSPFWNRTRALKTAATSLSSNLDWFESDLTHFKRGSNDAETNEPKHLCTKSQHSEQPPRPRPSQHIHRDNPWAFLLYCHIGSISADRDLAAQGLEFSERTFALMDICLPPRPMINLVLRDSESDDIFEPAGSSRFETQITFARKHQHQEKQDSSRSPAAASESVKRPSGARNASRRRAKRGRDVSSILETFGSG